MEQPAYRIFFSWTESYSPDKTTPAAFLQEDWLSSSFPDTNAYKLGFLHLTSKSVCKQEAAKVGGCETGKADDSSEKASVEQELDLATLLSFRDTTQPMHPQ